MPTLRIEVTEGELGSTTKITVDDQQIHFIHGISFEQWSSSPPGGFRLNVTFPAEELIARMSVEAAGAYRAGRLLIDPFLRPPVPPAPEPRPAYPTVWDRLLNGDG